MEVKNKIRDFINKKKILIILVLIFISFIIVISISNKINRNFAVKTEVLIRDNEDLKALELYGKKKKNKKYNEVLKHNLQSYSIELFNKFIDDTSNYDYYNKKFNLILGLYDIDLINENYEKFKLQKQYLDKIEQAKILEEENKVLEAYLEIRDIDSNECLIYSNLDKYKKELENKNSIVIDEIIKELTVIDSYIYIKNYPIKFDLKIEEYKNLAVEEINKHIINLSETETLNYLDDMYTKLNLEEIKNIKSRIQQEYEKKKEEERIAAEEAAKKKEEEEKIRLAQIKLDNILPEYTHEYFKTETRDGQKYWVFNSNLNEYPAQFRPYVNINTYDVYQLFVDDKFIKFGEVIKERYESVTIAQLNSNISYGGYRFTGRVVLVDVCNILLTDNKGNYVHVLTTSPCTAVIGDTITVTADYYGGVCDDKYGYFGIAPISIPSLSFGKVESFS